MSEIPEMFDAQGKQIMVGSLVVFLRDAVAERVGLYWEDDPWFRVGDVCMLISAENYKPVSGRRWTNSVTLVLLAQEAPMATNMATHHVPNYLKVLK